MDNNSVIAQVEITSSKGLKELKNLKKEVANSTQEIEKANSSIKNLDKSIQKAFNKSAIVAWYSVIKKGMNIMLNASKAQQEYIENLNLMQVAFKDTYKSADNLINTISKEIGLDPSNLVRQIGIYKEIGNAMGYTNNISTLLSENLLKLQMDMSSLYNVDFARAGKALESAITGNVKSIRALTGADVTLATLKQEALALGIDKSVNSMTRAEKTILTYLTLERQMADANGDMARTINSVANQTKIFKEQITTLARQIGALFIPILKTLLPLLNGVLMVINELTSMLLTLFGIDANKLSKEFGIASSGFEGFEDNFDNLEKSSEKAKKSLRGFDKLNAITTPQSQGTSNMTIGGVDKTMLDAMKEYNLHLEDMKNKAVLIKENIMKWIGFTKDANGEWKFSKVTIGTILSGVLGIGTGYLAIKKTIKAITSIKTIKDGILGLLGIGGSKKDVKDTADAILKTNDLNKAVTKTSSSLKLPSYKTILKGLSELAIIIGGLTLLIEAIGLFAQIPNVKSIAKDGVKLLTICFDGIMDIIIPLTLVSAGIVALGLIGVSTVAKGFADMAIIIGGTTVLITAIGGLLSIGDLSTFLNIGITSMVNMFEGLQKILLPLAEFSLLLIGLGLASPTIIVSGIAGFAIVVGGLTALLVALGELTRIDGFNWIIENGTDALMKVGEAIGGFAGSIIGGFVDKATEGLEKVGTHLSNFMINAGVFFQGLKNIGEETANSAKALAECILYLTASNILEGLTSWLVGGNSIEKFGAMLPEFGTNMKKYYNNVKGIDAGVVNASANSAKALAEFAKNIPNDGGMIAWFTGENSIDKFGKKLPSFGENFKKYYDNIKGIDGSIVKDTSNAVSSVIEFAKNIPNSGGMVAWFTGENNIDKFGGKLPSFGKKFKEYYNNIVGIDNDVIEASANSAKAIVEMAKNVPNEGGIVAWFTGENSISTFGDKLSSFGNSFKKYYNSVKDINTDTLNKISKELKSIVDLCEKIKNNKLVSTLEDFGDELKGFGKNVSSYYDKALSYTNGQSAGNKFADGIASGISSKLKSATLPKLTLSSGNSNIDYNIKFKADGGFVDKGQFFVAGEAGPEMIGTIGNKTAVANNDQIVESISVGVAKAMMATGGRNTNVNIVAEGDTSGLLNFITFKQRETNRQYGL